MSDPFFAAGDELSVAQLYVLLRLRSEVFVLEQQSLYNDIDGRDLEPDTGHFWVQPPAADEPVAYLRLLRDPDGTRRIGRVCTAKHVRGSGLGAQLMAAAMSRIGPEAAILNAQTHAQAFYARFGFEPEGTPFDEDGIEHITMRRPAQN